jgi:hypothetical protein
MTSQSNSGPFYVGQSLQISFDTNESLSGAQVKVKAILPDKTRTQYATGHISGSSFIFDFTPQKSGNHRFWLYGIDANNKTIISNPVDVFIREEGT